MNKHATLLAVLLILLVFSGCIGAVKKGNETTTLSTTTPAPSQAEVPEPPKLAAAPSAVNAKNSFYNDIKVVPVIAGWELSQIKYAKPPMIGEMYRSMTALKNYMIEATYSKDTNLFYLRMESLTQDGINEYNSQVSTPQSKYFTQTPMRMQTIEGEAGTPQITAPPPTSNTTTKTIDGVTVNIRSSVYYYLIEPTKEVASNSNFEYKWLKDGVVCAITGNGYKNPTEEKDPTSELTSTTEQIIRGSKIELGNYAFLGMKEYLPEPPSNWNLYIIEATKRSPSGYTTGGTMGVVGTYAKEAYEQYGGNLKDIRVTIHFGTAQLPRDLMDNTTLVIANKNVLSGYSYNYMYKAMRQAEEPYAKESLQPTQPEKQRENYMLIWVDRERYATVYAETKADFQPEYESIMKQFMTEILTAVYK